jgi:hypothetical protein
MSVNENGNLRPDGFSVSVPLFGFAGIGGTYYRNPGSPTAPAATVTGSLGINPGFGLHSVFLRKGMTSQDTLGYGVTGNVSTGLPSVTVNGSVPDENYVPQPSKTKLSSIEAGIGSPGTSAAVTYTWTPQQIADYLLTHGLMGAAQLGSTLHREALARPYPSVNVITPAMGPDDELSPFVRSLQSSFGTVGHNSEPPVRYLSSRYQNPLGSGMAGWSSSVSATNPQQPPQPAASSQQPGELLGLLLDHIRNN